MAGLKVNTFFLLGVFFALSVVFARTTFVLLSGVIIADFLASVFLELTSFLTSLMSSDELESLVLESFFFAGTGSFFVEEFFDLAFFSETATFLVWGFSSVELPDELLDGVFGVRLSFCFPLLDDFFFFCRATFVVGFSSSEESELLDGTFTGFVGATFGVLDFAGVILKVGFIFFCTFGLASLVFLAGVSSEEDSEELDRFWLNFLGAFFGSIFFVGDFFLT